MEVAELAGIPFFAQLTEEERERLAPCAKREVVPAGLVITVFGERGDEFYVIEDGHAYVSQDSGRLAELGPGDFFGEIALVEPGRRAASGQAAPARPTSWARPPSSSRGGGRRPFRRRRPCT